MIKIVNKLMNYTLKVIFREVKVALKREIEVRWIVSLKEVLTDYHRIECHEFQRDQEI